MNLISLTSYFDSLCEVWLDSALIYRYIISLSVSYKKHPELQVESGNKIRDQT